MRISSEELRRVAEFDEAIIRNQVGYAAWARASALCEGNKVTDVEIGDDVWLQRGFVLKPGLDSTEGNLF